MTQTTRAKLVTIIAPSELEHRVERDVRESGGSGYSVAKVDGHGRQGARKDGLFESGNVRIETIVSPDVAGAIFSRLSRDAETQDVVAFSQDIDVLPRKRGT
jgi:nitrogen regulatory protein PII